MGWDVAAVVVVLVAGGARREEGTALHTVVVRRGAAAQVSPRALAIASYALCGFSNLGSCGILIAGLSVMAPQQRPVLCAEVLRALVAATLACFATACVAGVLYDPESGGGELTGAVTCQ